MSGGSARRSGRPIVIALTILWPALVLANYYTQLHIPIAEESLAVLRLRGDFHLPYLRSAVISGFGAVASAGILLANALLLGSGICRLARWRFDNWREALPIAAVLGTGGFALAGLCLATAGLYRPGVLRLVSSLPAIATAGILIVTGRPWPGAARRRPGHKLRRADWPWIACAASALVMALIAALAPEIEYDALSYHLFFPRLYLEHGRLIDLPDEYVSLYPMTFELWLGYGLATGTQITAKLLHFACLPLTGLAAYQFTRRYAARASAWLASAIFITVPTVLWESATAYVDLALALYLTLALYALFRYAEQREQQWLLIAAVNLGLAAASKHLALFMLALACLGLLIYLWRAEGRLDRALVPPVALAAIALLFPLPWYLRSWLATGNPVFPELFGLFGGPADRWSLESQAGLDRFFAHFGRPRTLWNQLTLPWDVTIHGARYDGALGPLFLGLLPLLPLRRNRTARWLGGFVIGYIVLWASPLASFQLRWLIPITPLMAVLAAISFDGLQGRLRRHWGPVSASLAVLGMTCLLLLNLPPFTAFHEKDRHGWNGWLNSTLHGLPLGVVLGAESHDSYLKRSVPTYAAWRLANRSLPPDARVLVYSGGDQYYSERDRLWALATQARPVAFLPVGEERRALEGLRRLKVTHLLIERRFLTQSGIGDSSAWDGYAVTGQSARAQWYDAIYDDQRVVLFRIHPELVARDPLPPSTSPSPASTRP